jgi:hypothetical protein
MWIAIDRPGYSHARRNDGQNITPHDGGLAVLHRSPTAKRLPFLLRARACGRNWPIATFRCAAEFGRYRGIADIEQAAPIKLDL